MIKKIIIALVLVASVAAIAAPTFAALHSHKEDTQGNFVCPWCKGTGRNNGGTGNQRCGLCNGTGFHGSY